MRTKKTSRPAATGNGSINTKLRIIIADPKFRNKVYLAAMRGSVFGAVLAIFGGICYIDTNMLVGAVVAVAGMIWLGIFYILNAEDRHLYGG